MITRKYGEKNKMKKILIAVCFLLVTLTACKDNYEKIYSKEKYVLGTFVKISIYSKSQVPEELFDKCFAELQSIENNMTINKQLNSEVERINLSAGEEKIKISDETLYVIDKGIEYTKLTNNRFDISIGPLVKLWNIGFEDERVPKEEEIYKALGLLGTSNIDIDKNENTIKLGKKGMMIDLGAIAKGYAADKILSIIQNEGYNNMVISIGGNIICSGKKQDNNEFKIGLRNPSKDSNSYLGVIKCLNTSIVTSGIYERNFVENGVFYHHIIDSKTGYPVKNELASVTIITPKSIYADALSTGVFAMGYEDGIRFVEQLEGVEAIFITQDKNIYLTEGARLIFELTDKEYRLN